ncbi:PaaI family thioesterase [Salinibius halmophilus]|uniref:PaaI family thioesterase n=1 Tax=Salinibius halmophilus TaxID=1853216 RepID=UPI000E6627AA|nr:PaaI family thioesterase [Salinibius halmophilus]
MTTEFVGLAQLPVKYRVTEQGIIGRCQLNANWQGYQGLLHGGIAATLIDDAMVNCLLAHRIQAMTASLTLRYLHPVPVTQPMEVVVQITEQKRRLHCLQANLHVAGRVSVMANSKFMATAN